MLPGLTQLTVSATVRKMLAKICKSLWLTACVVSAITLVVFWPVLRADFVMWDDDRMIYMNPNLTGLSFACIERIFTHADVTRRYTPLAALNYSITYQFCRLNPFGYHLSPWLFHGVNAALVFFAIRILLIKGPACRDRNNADSWRISLSSALGTLLWSLHPLRVEPVAWAGANFYTQATFFLLLSLLVYLWANKANIDPQSHFRRVLISAGLFGAALLSHPIVLGFFLVFIVMDIYPLRRLGGDKGWWRTPLARRALLEKIPFVLTFVAIGIITVCIRIASAGVWQKPAGLDQFGLLDRFMQAMYIWAYYLWRPFWPVNLSPVYTKLVEFDPWSLPFITSTAIVIALVALLIFLRRRWPLGLVLGTCYLVLLVPVLGIFEYPHYSCDRYSLIVSVLFSVLAASLLAGPRLATGFRSAAWLVAVVVIAGLGTLTFRQTYVWHDSITLFEHIISTLGNDPYVADTHCRLGSFFLKQGRTHEAILHFEQAIRIQPDHAVAYNNLGVVYRGLDRRQEAMEAYRRAIRIKPDYADAHYNLGVAYYGFGRYQEAIEAYQQAIRIKPQDVKFHNNLGVAYYSLGRYQEAIEVYQQAIRIKPNDAISYNNLGAAYSNLGRYQEAIAAYQQAIKIKPERADTHLSLGLTYVKIGDTASATKEYEILKTLDIEMANKLFNRINK
jgi:tetratricopeptide (TPR) repeat protein